MKSARKMRCPILAVVMCLFILLLGACAPAPEMKTPSPARATRTLQFAVADTMDKELLEQASLFAADVAEISQGRITVGVFPVSEALCDTVNYDLLYLSNAQIAKPDSSLETLALPFLYNSTSHLSLALNAPEVKSIVEQRIETKFFPLAALSSGTSVLVTDKETSRAEMVMPEFFQKLSIGLISDSKVTADAFQTLGAQTTKLSTEEATLFFDLPILQAEQTDDTKNDITEELNTLEMSMTQALAVPTTQKHFALKTRHDLIPIWFVTNTEVWNTFSSWEKSVILEATAGLISRYEEERIRFQASWEKEMEKRGIDTIQTERTAFASMVYNLSDETLSSIKFDEQLFLFIQSYS